MDEQRKRAYRSLLYTAMLDIRRLAWLPPDALGAEDELARQRVAQQIRRAGMIADWLHNLALFASEDFRGFDEGWFWNELAALEAKQPDFDLSLYRHQFEAMQSGEP